MLGDVQSQAWAVWWGLPGNPDPQAVGWCPSATQSTQLILSLKGTGALQSCCHPVTAIQDRSAQFSAPGHPALATLSPLYLLLCDHWSRKFGHPLLVSQWVGDFQWRELPFLPLKRFLKFSCITGAYSAISWINTFDHWLDTNKNSVLLFWQKLVPPTFWKCWDVVRLVGVWLNCKWKRWALPPKISLQL